MSDNSNDHNPDYYSHKTRHTETLKLIKLQLQEQKVTTLNHTHNKYKKHLQNLLKIHQNTTLKMRMMKLPCNLKWKGWWSIANSVYWVYVTNEMEAVLVFALFLIHIQAVNLFASHPLFRSHLGKRRKVKWDKWNTLNKAPHWLEFKKIRTFL